MICIIFRVPDNNSCKNANHSSLIRNNVVPSICLRVMTYAWSDVTRNAGIRKTNRATRYFRPCIFVHAFNDVTYMINEYNVRIADACYYIAAHALPDAHCVIAFWCITFMLRKVLISVSEWPWQRDPFTVGENFHGETPSHKTYPCQ